MKLRDDLKIVEGVAGYYYYHLSTTGENGKPALCGESKVMSTQLRLSSWGSRGHLNEKYCEECARIGTDETP